MRGIFGGPGHTSLVTSIWGLEGAAGFVDLAGAFFVLAKADVGTARASETRTAATTTAVSIRLGCNLNFITFSTSLDRQPILMAGITKCHVVGLVLHQQPWLG